MRPDASNVNLVSGQTVANSVAYELEWLEAPFSKVFGKSLGTDVGFAEAESDEPGAVSALVC